MRHRRCVPTCSATWLSRSTRNRPTSGPRPIPLIPGLPLAPPSTATSPSAAGRRGVVGPPAIDYAIEAYSLEKIYRTRNGRQPAVDKLDLRVPVGGVHGFLG